MAVRCEVRLIGRRDGKWWVEPVGPNGAAVLAKAFHDGTTMEMRRTQPTRGPRAAKGRAAAVPSLRLVPADSDPIGGGENPFQASEVPDGE